MSNFLESIATILGCITALLIGLLFYIGIPFALFRWLWRKGSKNKNK